MALIVERTCDFTVTGPPCGSTTDVTPSSIVVRGHEWTLDLCSSHAKDLAGRIESIGAVRRAEARDLERSYVSRSGSRFSAREARSWLRSNGHRVSDAGRLSKQQLSMYALNH